MKTKDFVVWLIILLIVLGAYFFIKKTKKSELQAIPYPTPSVEDRVSVKFGGLTIPNDLDKAELKGVADKDALGIATRKYSNGKFVLTVLGDLAEPKAGYFYEAWLLGNNKELVSLGTLRQAKGGYLVDFTSSKDYSSLDSIFVTVEKKHDVTPEEHVLEGSF